MDQLIVEDPARIGPYRLIARLGAGGMGLVYLGRSEGGRTVAVKVVQAEYAGNPEFRRRFAREVAAARRVGGSWTAAVLDADPEAAVPWVATRYIPGPDLHAVVAKDFGPLPEHSVRTLANRLALALRAVHEAGLIHRDLKPSNVLITVDGPRVIDFGIARAMDSLAGDSLLTHTGMLIGSAGFMSPEQVRGLELTPASDVFCLGAVLVYAATGRLLFGAADTGLNAHLFRVAEEEPDLTGVPEELVELVRDCLHKDPTRRPTPAQVAERTAADHAGEWLPGAVLAQLGRHAAQLLDYAPATPDEAPAGRPDPRVPSPRPHLPPPPAYAPTAPAQFGPAQGFGPPPGAPAGAWSAAPSAAPQDSAAPHTGRRRGLAVAALVQLMVVLTATVFGMALPDVQADLDIGSGGLSAMFTAYVVSFGALLLLGGHLADLVGRKRTLLIGLAGFAAACLLGGTAGDSGLLIAARVLQGVSAALLTPAALSLVTAGLTDPKERARAFGVYATFAGGSSVLALLAGASILGSLGWRWCLYAPLALAVLALIGTLTLPQDRSDAAGSRLDVPGVLLGSGGLAALTFGLGEIGSSGGVNPLVLILLAVGVALLVAFLWSQTRTASPLLAPYVFTDRNRIGALLALLLAGTGTLALFSALAFDLGRLHGYLSGASWIALLLLIASIVIGSTQVSARLAHRAAPQVLIAGGLVLVAAGLLLLTGDPGPLSVERSLPSMVLTGLGLGMALVPLFATVTARVAPRHAGGASAAIATAQHLGEAIGGMLLSLVLASLSRAEAAQNLDRTLLGGYSTVLWCGFGALLLAALIGGLLVTAREPQGPGERAAGLPR
ncbi:bifunctional serine/threonine protein kinase/MFS transporter [Streptomyces sp. DSM 116496]|uniref:bifunctional serine/threonine protein kinase/MFS transporter n=1 Tax=Streptomyces stoeckheimensis TaxID=3344656 RepID=UPI0038B2AE7D